MYKIIHLRAWKKKILKGIPSCEGCLTASYFAKQSIHNANDDANEKEKFIQISLSIF